MTNVIAESWHVSFYVSTKSWHIRKIARVHDSSHNIKCDKFLPFSERHWGTTRQPRLVSVLSLLSKGIADPLNCELSTIICYARAVFN